LSENGQIFSEHALTFTTFETEKYKHRAGKSETAPAMVQVLKDEHKRTGRPVVAQPGRTYPEPSLADPVVLQVRSKGLYTLTNHLTVEDSVLCLLVILTRCRVSRVLYFLLLNLKL
jgi:hypothetical protein